MEKKLNLSEVLTQGIQLGIKNFVPLLLTVVLYVVTVWIPYLNVGTTIGLYKLIIAMSKGETIDPLSIFNKDNFTQIGDYFLLVGFTTAGVVAASAFMLVPAIIIGIAWCFSTYLLFEKKISPLKALSLSYKVTYGEKWTIFFIVAACLIAISIVSGIFGLIPVVGGVLSFILVLLGTAIFLAVYATMYSHFSEKADEILKED